ncbi:MAG TPA: efflux RND transporter periplasmic adaptor subunit [Pyrinomonadaceae bacterium]|nr:efflux RND transporter periplasmic adaptor subunit [Pyrinomonadaceae bacterium]
MTSRSHSKSPLAALVVAAACLASAACGSRAETKTEVTTAQATPAPAVDVSTAPAVSRQLPRFTEATGSLAADEQTDVSPQVGGRVAEVYVDLGTYVQRGQPIARLDAEDAQLRLQQLEAQAAQAQSAVRQAEERIGMRAGSRFEATRVAEVGAARAALELAEKQLKRFERLIESGDVSRSAYDQQRAQRDQLREQYQAALAQANQSYAAVGTAREAARAAQAQVAQARKGVRDVNILAPISGFVSDRPADPGEFVSTSSKVATIVRTNPLRMRIDIPEQQIGTVAAGQNVSVSVSSYPDRSFAGRVVRVSPSISAASRTLTVEAEVENSGGLLKPGQFATVRIQRPESQPAVLVPARAVRSDGTTARVYVVKDGRAQERLVQLGQTEGELVEVKSGVAADELVATSNLENLSDGALVRQ